MQEIRPGGRRGREDPALRGGTAASAPPAMLVRAGEVPQETARPPNPRRSRRYFGVSCLEIRPTYFPFLLKATAVLQNKGEDHENSDKFPEINFIAMRLSQSPLNDSLIPQNNNSNFPLAIYYYSKTFSSLSLQPFENTISFSFPINHN